MALVGCCWGAAGAAPDFSLWDGVLKRHVTPGGMREGAKINVVDYCGMKKDPAFAQFLKQLETVNTTGLSRQEFYALFMNVYNVFAVNTLIRSPLAPTGKCALGIRNVTVAAGTTVWDQPAGIVGGKMWSLDGVEHLLRDPTSMGLKEDCRAHACIVCDGVSCPNLRAEAYVPDRLDAQMDDNVRDWLASPYKGTLALPDNKGVEASAIFKWFGSDFSDKCNTTVPDFLRKYSPPDVAAVIEGFQNKGAEVPLSYFDYNWDANGVMPCDC